MLPGRQEVGTTEQEARSGHEALCSQMSLAKDGLMPFAYTMENKRAVRIKDSETPTLGCELSGT